MRRIRYKIKSRLISSQACPVDCYDAQLHLIVVLLEKVVPQSPFITLSSTRADSKAKMLIIMNKHNKDLIRSYSNSHHAVTVHELHQKYIHLRLLSRGMHVPLVEFMYLEFTRMQGERYLRRDIFFVVAFVWRLSSAAQLPCLLIQHRRSGALCFWFGHVFIVKLWNKLRTLVS